MRTIRLLALAGLLSLLVATPAAGQPGAITFHGTIDTGAALCDGAPIPELAYADTGVWNLNVNTVLDPRGRATATIVVRSPNGPMHAFWTPRELSLTATAENDPQHHVYVFAGPVSYGTFTVRYDDSTGGFSYTVHFDEFGDACYDIGYGYPLDAVQESGVAR